MSSVSKVVCHALAVAVYITVYDLHTVHARTHTHIISTGHKHECPAHAMCYTYQTLTAKPVFMAEKTVSLMELIATGHAVAEPHDAGVRSQRSYSTVLEPLKYEPFPL
jgi:hypothetical protein